MRALKIWVCFHQALSQRDIQRRKGQRTVPVDFDELAARAEQQHRPELRIYTTVQDQFVAFQLDHRLYRHAAELVPAHPFRNRGLDGLIRLADRSFILQVKLDSTDICSVTCPVNVVSRGHGSQLVSEFFGCGCQTSDAVLAITVFECGGTFVHVRLAPSQEPVNKSS